jgi:hypothetical protein
MTPTAKQRDAYGQQKRKSIRRNIPFMLTLDEWLAIWLTSGHWPQRGRRRGQYHMARKGDVGPYAVGNVDIITGDQNRSEAMKGRKLPPRTAEHRRNLSLARAGKGHPISDETKRKMRETALRQSDETKHKKSQAALKRARDERGCFATGR